MKRLVTALSISLAPISVAAAAPVPAGPSPVAAPAPAPSADRIELARRFIALTFSADGYIELMHAGAAQMVEALSANFGSDEDEARDARQQVERYLAAAEPKVRAHMPRLMEAYAQVYAREFSAEELQQLVGFAQSPAGKRYLSATDSLDLDPVVLKAQQELGEELEPIMDEMRKDMCAEKAAKRIAAGELDAKCPLSEPETAQG